METGSAKILRTKSLGLLRPQDDPSGETGDIRCTHFPTTLIQKETPESCRLQEYSSYSVQSALLRVGDDSLNKSVLILGKHPACRDVLIAACGDECPVMVKTAVEGL